MAICFVSYTAVDSAWAEWLAAVLRDAGHRVTVQATDFLPGDNFVLRMQEAAAESDHTLVIMSENFLRSRFGASEWAAAFVQDPTGKHRRLIPVAVDDVSPPGLWSAIVRISIADLPEEQARDEVLRAVEPMQKPAPAFPGGRAAVAAPAPQLDQPQVDVWRLSNTPARMIGRSAESEVLTRAWLSERENIVAVSGWGGAGKTTLVGTWLAEMAAYRYHGAQIVFAWSFDGQSDADNWATSDQFFDALTRFLGVDGINSATTWERCRAAVDMLQRTRALVVLDGVERIQHPPGALEGTFRERVMQMFIRELAALNSGMLVLTSRLPVIEIDAYVGRTCTTLPIPELSRSESIQILTEGGVRGDSASLSRIANEVRDHPLSLRLLSGYLKTVYGGDARMWISSGLSDAVSNEGGNASAIMDQYAAWFEGKAELQLLQMLGLFNREASEEELAALRELPRVQGLNDEVTGLTRADLAYTLENLRRAGMIERSPNRGVVEAHPLVREYFQRTFREKNPEAFKDGHRRLRNVLATKSEARPQDLAACAPVIDAIWHATRAGENVDALRSLYEPRLAQEHHFLRDGVGAAASNHAALSYILDDTGGEVLADVDRARLLADQSLDLRMMGNASEAVFPLADAIRLTRHLDDADLLVNQLRHLSQLQLSLGKVDEACRHAEEAVRLTAGRELGDLEALSARTSYVYALLHAGRYAASRDAAQSCGLFGRGAQDDFAMHASRVTFCIAVYRTCDALLALAGTGELGDPRSALDAAKEVVDVGMAASEAGGTAGLLGAALLNLSASRVAAITAEPGQLKSMLDQACDDLAQVGQRPWIIESNLVRCRELAQMGRAEDANAALSIAERLADEDGAVLQALQCRIERARAHQVAGVPAEGRWRPLTIVSDAGRLGLVYLEENASKLASI